MAHDDHIREKAIYLRTQKQMSLNELIEHLHLPRTTIYGWIKDIPLSRPHRQSIGQVKGTAAMRAKYAALRDDAYQQGWEEAPELIKDPTFRDFVVLYMAEGTKRNRNSVEIVNSDPKIVRLAYKWIQKLTHKPLVCRIQYHADHDENELMHYWGEVLEIDPQTIRFLRKSNSNQLSKRQFRSQYGIISINVSDTYLRARLQAWMDFIKTQW